MVIISKDDYLSFMNEVGVRMQAPSVNVNNQLSTTISASVVGVGGGAPTTFRNNNIDSQISLIPSQFQPPLPQAQQHLQQLQQQSQQQQQQQQTNGNGTGVGVNNKSQQVARAVLVCRPNSHPFQVSSPSFFYLKKKHYFRKVCVLVVANTKALDCIYESG